MLGPHFYYDLIRVARKGRTSLLRCVYLLALLGGIWYISDERLDARPDRNQLARAGQDIVKAVIVLQYALVFVLTPAMVSGAIVEERERGTLDLLFTTQLTNREIVLGKLGARFANLAVIVLSSLPLLAFIHFWGGVDMRLITFHYVQAFLIQLLSCAACLWVSAEVATLMEARIVSYFLMGAFSYVAFVIGPAISGAYELEILQVPRHPALYLAMPAVYLAGTALFAWGGIRAVRRRSMA